MTTVNRSWKEERRGGTAIVANKTINGSDNPFIGQQLGHYRSRASDEADVSAFYVVSYLIEEYGDEAIEEVSEMSKEERDAYVGAIEDRLADDDNADPRTALNDIMEN